MDPSTFPASFPTPGLAEAVARYGEPAVRAYTFAVSQASADYWQLVRRNRAAEVVFLIRRPNGRYLVQTKSVYPAGVYRLMSGGIKRKEDLLAALLREIHEETGLTVRVERFLGILGYHFEYGELSQPFISYLFVVAEEGGTLGAQDTDEDISGYREVTVAELGALAEQLEGLAPDWVDWGRFRAAAHRFALEQLSA
jgi:8-oxo-dGTP pyrophosphatase MutT (NUDIX family)